jgi:hypothetical protein
MPPLFGLMLAGAVVQRLLVEAGVVAADAVAGNVTETKNAD